MATTGPDGKITFPDLIPGVYMVQVTQAVGYRLPASKEAHVLDGQTTSVNFFLEAQAGVLDVVVLDNANAPVSGATVIITLKVP